MCFKPKANIFDFYYRSAKHYFLIFTISRHGRTVKEVIITYYGFLILKVSNITNDPIFNEAK